MKEYIINNSILIRIWLKDFPFEEYVSTYNKYNYPSFTETETILYNIAIEIYIPSGGRAKYGFIGASFNSDYKTGFSLRLPDFSIEKGVFNNSSYTFDEVYIGITDEYIEAIHNTIRDLAISDALPIGCLTFNRSAFSLVGTSYHVVCMLSKLIIDFILHNRSISIKEILLRFITKNNLYPLSNETIEIKESCDLFNENE